MSSELKPKKRLILCLDGTWNNQNDSTNVLHLYNLVGRGDCDGVEQKRYYDRGVGTGVLDNVSGGAFGFGLDENVKESVDWLIDNYEDGDDTHAPDEIYVFGFSRGAYTARSLVGFLAKCGLPRRGAPLTVNQLWEAYRVFGNRDEQRTNWWEKLAGAPETACRTIEKLVEDTWRAGLPDDDWRKNYKAFKEPENLTEAEKLLQKWCRRPPITCLGIFDTVGSMGAEALSIPGIRSKLAAHHNMRLHSIIGHGLHAIALDENRSNFNLTPLVEFVPGNAPSKNPDRTILQRWFVGAHSNVGGGYEDNKLASWPLHWMIEELRKIGLCIEQPPHPPEPAAACLAARRDSYAEFASPLWLHVMRAKRNFRVIAPCAEARAWKGRTQSYSLRRIGEGLHESAVDAARHMAKEGLNPPPNLIAHLSESRSGIGQAEFGKLQAQCRHIWIGKSWTGWLALMAWSFCASAGLYQIPALFAQSWPKETFFLVAAIGALIVPLVDWAESALTHDAALHPASGTRRAGCDVLYWIRATLFVFFVIGLPYVLWTLGSMLWHLDLTAWRDSPFWQNWHWTLGLTAAGSMIPLWLSRPPRAPKKPAKSALAMLLVIVLIPTAFLIARAALRQTFEGFSGPPEIHIKPEAGALLALEILFLCFLQSFLQWVGQPTSRIGLSTIATLQVLPFAAMIRKQLNHWATSLLRKPLDDEKEGERARRAAAQMGQAGAEALWRDSLGFVPLYTGLFVYGLWFAAESVNPECPISAHWLAIPLGIGLLDLVENITHLGYLRAYVRSATLIPAAGSTPEHVAGDAPRTWLAPLIFLCSITKIVFFTICMLIILGALFTTGWRLLFTTDAGWRGAVAVGLWGFITLGGFTHALILAKAACEKISRWLKK